MCERAAGIGPDVPIKFYSASTAKGDSGSKLRQDKYMKRTVQNI